jgi:hypothetical protein
MNVNREALGSLLSVDELTVKEDKEDRRSNLQLNFDVAKAEVETFEAKVKKEPGNWLWVQLYAEWWAEMEIARRALARLA